MFEEFMVILYVSDQEKSRSFYSQLLKKEPVLDVPGMAEFELKPGLKLGLMPVDGIAGILGNKTPHPSSGHGIPRCELYLSDTGQFEMYHRAIKAGAKEISPISVRNWGHSVGYVSDPDGHIVAFYREI